MGTSSVLVEQVCCLTGKTPFELVFDREYKGTLAPWGSVVVAKPLPKTKEKGKVWKKGIFVGKDIVSNMNRKHTKRNHQKSNNETMFANR